MSIQRTSIRIAGLLAVLVTCQAFAEETQPIPPDDCRWYRVYQLVPDASGDAAHLVSCQEFCVEVVDSDEVDAWLWLGASIPWRNLDGTPSPIPLTKVGNSSGPVQHYDFSVEVTGGGHPTDPTDHENYKLITWDLDPTPNEAMVIGVKHETGPVHGGSAHARY